ncbi:tRNA lysidine(34) synthetase TilS [Spirulina sp. CS-785/01]|uniref:tRNA lysidine(34) synthetase TilS n=1 Tax=Spirulina sp. CS-785/01 TaxID=3021716 RepID=UPI00232DF646|nr:tRNA lysidine(34) synthetase TilS [Spirulina sp. CS-785/01]MDB9313664.1 tRNA lysidine(34) synthetase TilS [Spirulina sp. CS-785/01]
MVAQDWTFLHDRLHQLLRRRPLLPPQATLLVAVSGGQDSLCLLKLLRDLQEKWGWGLAVAHCDHGWTTDAGIADHVRQVCEGWGLPFYLREAENLPETEAAARAWRYEQLAGIAAQQGQNYLVTGHTQSDRAETLLYNLIRGAGADGLQALTWQRPLNPQLQLVRPLLTTSRSETGTFCQTFSLQVWEDAANENLHYARNHLRQRVIPYLKEQFNPQVERNLAHTAELLQAEVAWLENQAQTLLQQAQTTPTQLHLSPLQAAPLALQRRAIRLFLSQHLPNQPTFEQIEAVCHLLESPNRSQTSTFPGGIVVRVQKPYLIIPTAHSKQ